jgi:hypothetical protein
MQVASGVRAAARCNQMLNDTSRSVLEQSINEIASTGSRY